MAPLTKKQLERNRKGGIALRNKYGMEYLRQMGKRGGQTTSRRVRRGRRAIESLARERATEPTEQGSTQMLPQEEPGPPRTIQVKRATRTV